MNNGGYCLVQMFCNWIYELEDEDWEYDEQNYSLDHSTAEVHNQNKEVGNIDEENVFLCDFCCYTFDDQEELVRHMIRDHP